ncbi:unnamed protein product [Adineta steineri]|uniref:DUF5648 domain-containing protein n=1 Tax=Adineta steineri TaxID=433720 RepID=A0A819W9Q8_9BILA|nr:unnamed protein product [Adineta steineri]CAF4120794.1 unnamed protein product [Adineta steineri]
MALYPSAYIVAGPVPWYKYSTNNGWRYFTTNANEIGTITPGATGHNGLGFERIECEVYDRADANRPSNTVPLYQYKHKDQLRYFYTTRWQDVGTYVTGVLMGSWRSEGIAAYVYSSSQVNTIPLYQYKMPGGYLFYTTDACEIGSVWPGLVGRHGFTYEKVAAYVLPKYGFLPGPVVCH